MKPWQNAKQFAIHANIEMLQHALEWGKFQKCGYASLMSKFDTENCPTEKW